MYRRFFFFFWFLASSTRRAKSHPHTTCAEKKGGPYFFCARSYFLSLFLSPRDSPETPNTSLFPELWRLPSKAGGSRIIRSHAPPPPPRLLWPVATVSGLVRWGAGKLRPTLCFLPSTFQVPIFLSSAASRRNPPTDFLASLGHPDRRLQKEKQPPTPALAPSSVQKALLQN